MLMPAFFPGITLSHLTKIDLHHVFLVEGKRLNKVTEKEMPLSKSRKTVRNMKWLGATVVAQLAQTDPFFTNTLIY